MDLLLLYQYVEYEANIRKGERHSKGIGDTHLTIILADLTTQIRFVN